MTNFMNAFLCMGMFFILRAGYSQDTLSLENGRIHTAQAKAFIGKEACVCGKVVSTRYMEKGNAKPTYINLDKKFPDQVFTLIIYGADRKNFSYKPEEFLMGKAICVRGKIGVYKDVPQIIASKEKQVEILPE